MTLLERLEAGERVDIGGGNVVSLSSWAPDRGIAANAERFAGVPDEPRFGLVWRHPAGPKLEGAEHCIGSITFDNPSSRTTVPERSRWTVETWEPLTISPSLLCMACGAHGFIRDGRWVPA